ncbi:pyridine nucleotide-disulfide oxidoreductase : Pyridine nucleotide-disulfide oxidoreductase OS=Cystobacter violaceus Cb vi76 GN=Q664_49925 PE=4 SV=1: Pyr_redox_2: Pyr_redox: Pyr_redox_dim [Gemmataceae bacterium]|nr:pyridine nucleotide-disulfide oxidoreductase : Pyridine nucleotide-disulfide oxidoreductase OS=Cystobacter violaceus Cb vi76 GN=Q664_49925 PE=4 SV=1: Pyr_redox_2: Pyr_redox: Pyr_redox_dim [Gemmataceae bacterium]VTT99412.1 pyridine nucleotide-disulfide oxidoreductase : Pyridine nucleotide-disulfide oxidoreductase OS=Cystobacter violaceus Cb vi76 GN=Q664_49925 PE=4 SV=1: Pyr_redox_2: Pyr_redox: Pyr_redox_dim [Gemmataceae bacterium]
MTDSDAFDLVVIGAGPGGETAAVTAARLGKRVALIEKAPFVGGAAVNTGTLPSKTLRETALALSGLRSRDLYGVDLSLGRDATIDDVLRHERTIKAAHREQIRGLLTRYGVELVHGAARFAGPHTVRVAGAGGERDLTADKIVVATGSVPLRPPGFPFEHTRVHDSDELLDLHQMPRSIAVVGAGVIGSEYACMFAALGVETHLVDGRDALLPFLDADLSAALEAGMRRLGVRFVWGETVASCDAPPEGDVRLGLSSGGTLVTHHVLICAGRTSRTAELDPAAAGLDVAPKGRLAVNAQFQTNVPHIYAVGDVIGFPALASTSAEQGRAAAGHAFGEPCRGPVAPVLPTGIYTIPEVSSAGATEAELRAQGVEFLVGRAEYADVARGKIIGDAAGFLKLLFRRSDRKLLGAHVIGELASEVVHIGVLTLMTGAGADLLLQTCFNHPTLGELYKLATHDALLRERTGAAPGR